MNWTEESEFSLTCKKNFSTKFQSKLIDAHCTSQYIEPPNKGKNLQNHLRSDSEPIVPKERTKYTRKDGFSTCLSKSISTGAQYVTLDNKIKCLLPTVYWPFRQCRTEFGVWASKFQNIQQVDSTWVCKRK
jgi:hypothetical protein